MRLPVDLSCLPEEFVNLDVHRWKLQIFKHFKLIQRLVRRHSEKLVSRSIDRPSMVSVDVGDVGLLWDHRHAASICRQERRSRTSKKLLLRWRGPMRVIKTIGSTGAYVQDTRDSKIYRCHISHLKPFDVQFAVDGSFVETQISEQKLKDIEASLPEGSLEEVESFEDEEEDQFRAQSDSECEE
jgi:hypothetical protein